METALDVSGVQRIVLRGAGLSCVRHYFLGVTQLLDAYVTTRGTLYGFLPSLRTLAAIDAAAA